MGGRMRRQGCRRGAFFMTDEQEPNAVRENPRAIDRQQWDRRQWLLTALAMAVALVLLGIALRLWGMDAYVFLTDEQALEDLVLRMGVWGPLVLILFNVVQIVVAPVPGYMVQLAAGYLYGPLWGGIYAAIGVLLGAMTAMWLARTLGRPMARLLVGESRLARWESVTHSDSVWVWLLLLLGPVGDVPYLLAGLSRVSYLTIFLITLFIRVPSVFLSSAIGGGAVPLVWFFVVVGVAGVILLVGLRYKSAISAWYERTLNRQVEASLPSSIASPSSSSVPALESNPDESHSYQERSLEETL